MRPSVADLEQSPFAAAEWVPSSMMAKGRRALLLKGMIVSYGKLTMDCTGIDFDLVILNPADIANLKEKKLVTPEPEKPPPIPCTMHPVVSSNVAAVGHDGTALVVQFTNKTAYRYPTAGAEHLEAVLKAPSAGQYLRKTIIPHHKGEPVKTGVPT